jgi:hypothetical protein
MKQINNEMNNSIENLLFSYKLLYRSTVLLTVIFFGTLLTGCMKQKEDKSKYSSSSVPVNNKTSEVTVLYGKSGLSSETLLQLQEVKDATAKYHSVENAFKDQYVDINLKLQNMGYHFLKSGLVSPVFDLRKPPILVYNKKDNGDFELVAVEYAVPIDWGSPNTPPEGFAGDADQWDFNTLNTGWWTLHAWVWQLNPDGVFKPMNPSVIVK